MHLHPECIFGGFYEGKKISIFGNLPSVSFRSSVSLSLWSHS